MRTRQSLLGACAAFCLLAGLAHSATTPGWVETFAGMTGGPYNTGSNTAPALVMTGLVNGLPGMTLDWVCGSTTTDGQFNKDTTFAYGAPSGGIFTPPENANRLGIMQCATPANNSGMFGPLSQGPTTYWKYDFYVCFPATTGSIGNMLLGVSIADLAGNRLGDTAGMIIHMQIGRNVVGSDPPVPDNPQHVWRIRQVATINTEITKPGYMITDFQTGKWVKITFEHDPSTLSFKGYFDDQLDFTHTYTAGALDGWDATKSCIGFRSYGAADAELYIDDITYTNVPGSTVQDWKGM